MSTHRDGNILDLILTNRPRLVRNLSIEPGKLCPSDYTICFKICKNIFKKKGVKKRVFHFAYKKSDWHGMNRELNNINWQYELGIGDIIRKWNLFKSKIDITMRKFIPIVNIKCNGEPPWFDSEIREKAYQAHA